MVKVEFHTQDDTTITKTLHMHCLVNLLEYGGVYKFKVKATNNKKCEWFNCGSALETPENDVIRKECVKKPAEYLLEK